VESFIAVAGVTQIENSAAKTCLDVRRTVSEAAVLEKSQARAKEALDAVNATGSRE
jgi:hypothetical protein